MRIKQLIIKNFRSLKELNLQNLQNLVVLIGENSSGKTNFLEAMDLFFNSFDHSPKQPKRSLAPEDWYLWFECNTEEAIELQITLEGLSNEQVKLLSEAANIKQLKGDLVIGRSIVSEDNNLVYQNDSIQWGAVTIKRSDTGYSIEDGMEFDPNAFVQAVNDKILRNAFSYIATKRGEELSKAHGSILAPEVKQELISKGGDVTPKGMQKWNKLRKMYGDRGWTPTQFECRGNQLLIPRGTTPIPYELEGTGYQALLNILQQIVTGRQIVAIEEPENHLHPHLQKIFVREIRELFSTKKQIFLATHSPFIIDLADFSSLWFVHKDELESKVQDIATVEGINDVLLCLGVRPSDFLFANGILVVEGQTDAAIYTDWARRIGKPFDTAGICVIDVEGCGNIKKYLKSEAIQRTSLKTLALCDKNAEAALRKVVKGIVADKNIFALGKGDLEDYYPRRIVKEFAIEMATKKGKKEEEIPNNIKAGETVKILDKLLSGDWWKTQLAERVRHEMQTDEIDKDVKSTLTKIYDSIYQGGT